MSLAISGKVRNMITEGLSLRSILSKLVVYLVVFCFLRNEYEQWTPFPLT